MEWSHSDEMTTSELVAALARRFPSPRLNGLTPTEHELAAVYGGMASAIERSGLLAHVTDADQAIDLWCPSSVVS